MDFEIIVLIAGAIYYIYSNYKKLTEENKQKQQQQQQNVEPKKTQTQSVQREKTTSFEWKKPDSAEQVREFKKDTNVFETKYENIYREPSASRLEHGNAKIEHIVDEYIPTTDLVNPEKLPEEVLRVNRAHKQHGHYAKVFQPVEEENPYADLDLRDAIIKSTILHRPQY